MSVENSPMKVDTTSLLPDKIIYGKDKQYDRAKYRIYQKWKKDEKDRKCVCCKSVKKKEFTRLIHSGAGIRKQMAKILNKVADVRITHGIVCYACEKALLHLYRLFEKYREKILSGLDEMIEKDLIEVDFDQGDSDSDIEVPLLSRYKQNKPKTYPDILKIEMEKVDGNNSLSDAPDGMTLILRKSDTKEVHSGDSTKIPYIITSQKPIIQSKNILETTALNKKGIGIKQNYFRIQKQGTETKSTFEYPLAVDELSKEVQNVHGTKRQTDTVLEKPNLKSTSPVKTPERGRQDAQTADIMKNPKDNTSQENVVQIISDDDTIENSGEEFIGDIDKAKTVQTHQSNKVQVSLANQSACIASNAIQILNVIPIKAKPTKIDVTVPTQNLNTTVVENVPHATQTPGNRVSDILQQKTFSWTVEKKNPIQSQNKRLETVFANGNTNTQNSVVSEKTEGLCAIKMTKNSAITAKNVPQAKQLKSSMKTQMSLCSRTRTKKKQATIQRVPRTIKMKEPLPQVIQMSSPLVLRNPLNALGLQQPIQINYPLILQNQVNTLGSKCQQVTASSIQNVSQATLLANIGALPKKVSASKINSTMANALIVQSLPQAQPPMELQKKVNAYGKNIAKGSSAESLFSSQAKEKFAYIVTQNPLKRMQIDAKQSNNIQDYAIKNIEFLTEETLEASANNQLENGTIDGSHDKNTTNYVSTDNAGITNVNQTVDNRNDNLNHEFECDAGMEIKHVATDKVEKIQAVGSSLKIQNVFSLKQSSNKENLCKVRTDQIIHIDSKTILDCGKRNSKPRPILPKAMPEVPVKPVPIEFKKIYVKMDHTYAAERNANRKRKVEEHLPRKVVIDRIRCRKLHNTNLNPHIDHTYKSEKPEVRKKPGKQKKRKTLKPQKKRTKHLNGKIVDEVVGIEKLHKQIDSDNKVTEIQKTRKAGYMEENDKELFCESSDDMSEMEDMITEDTKPEKRRRIAIGRDKETQKDYNSKEEISEYEGGIGDYYLDDEVYTATRLGEQPAVEAELNEHVDENIANVVLDHIQEFDLMQDLYTTTI